MFKAARGRRNMAKFKNAFRQKFTDTHMYQFHYKKMKPARETGNENPEILGDGYRALVQKITWKVDDPVAQGIHNEKAERMFLASFVAGLSGEPGRQTRFANPSNLSQVLLIVLAVQEAERQEKANNSFYKNFENSAKPQPRSPNQRYSEKDMARHSVATSTVSKSTKKASNSNTRSAQTKEALR